MPLLQPDPGEQMTVSDKVLGLVERFERNLPDYKRGKYIHRGVSERHLQGYLNEYTFRYSHRNDEQPMFFSILHRMIDPAVALAA